MGGKRKVKGVDTLAGQGTRHVAKQWGWLAIRGGTVGDFHFFSSYLFSIYLSTYLFIVFFGHGYYIF